MVRLAFVAALIVCTNASAQNAQPNAGRDPVVVENAKHEPLSSQFCLFDDKKYSEGAVMTSGSHALICMVKDRMVMTDSDGRRGSRELIWELGSSLRGKGVLNTAGSSKK